MITLALRDVCLHAPHGRYVVTYDGDGEIDFAMDANPVAFQKGASSPVAQTRTRHKSQVVVTSHMSHSRIEFKRSEIGCFISGECGMRTGVMSVCNMVSVGKSLRVFVCMFLWPCRCLRMSTLDGARQL